MDRGAIRFSAGGRDVTEKNGSNKIGNRRVMTMMNQKYTSLQSDNNNSAAKSSEDSRLTRSCSSQALAAMKPSVSMGDFGTREVTKVLPTSVAQETGNLSEVSERSSSARSRTSAPEGTFSQQQQQQQQQLSTDVSHIPNSTLKGSENKSSKLNEKEDSLDPLNPANASAKHRRERFVKHFSDVASGEELLQYYYCAYSREILFPGFMYVTQEWICFHSKIMGKKNIRIPIESIVEITKAKTAKLIPNAICIATRQDRHVFASLVSRDRTFSLLMKLWKPKPKPEDEDSLNGSSQNGERNDANDDISGFSDDNTASGSDETPLFDSHDICESRNELTSGGRQESADVKRKTGNGVLDASLSHDVTAVGGGRKSDPTGDKTDDRHSWRTRIPLQIPLFSSTTIVLFLTTILIVFLIVSACMLALKLVQLQSQMEASLLPSSSPSFDIFPSDSELHNQVKEDIYNLKHEKHMTNVERLHALLDVHLKLLDKVHQSLKSLRQSTPSDCSGLPADEYTQDSNS